MSTFQIILLILMGTLWVPLLFSLEIQFYDKLKYNFKFGPFSLNPLFDLILEPSDKKNKAKGKKTPSTSAKKKPKNKSKLNPILKRLLLSPRLIWALTKWGFKGLKVFYPMTKPKWPYARFEFGTGNPFSTSEFHQKLLIIGQLSSFKKIDLHPDWTHKRMGFEIKASWNLIPAIILIKTLFYILHFPFYTLIKSLYFASSKQRWESRQKNQA